MNKEIKNNKFLLLLSMLLDIIKKNKFFKFYN